MNNKGSITTSLISLTIWPLFIFWIAVLAISTDLLYESYKKETKSNLNMLIHSIYQSYELLYPGEYNVINGKLFKGENELSGQFGFVDYMKRMTGADITIFYGDVSHITTIKGEDGSRATGTAAPEEAVRKVLINGKEFFSDDLVINDERYFSYYMPLVNSESEIIGMMFAGKSRDDAMTDIYRNIVMVCLVEIGIMAIVTVIVLYYSRKVVFSLNETKMFLEKVAKGDLTAQINPYVIEREDEVGEMGRFAVMLRDSITDLVGKDPLTGLYNRRSCDVVLENLMLESRRKGSCFTVAMSDIDFFKRINDTYGHQVGDDVLKMIADVIKAHMKHLGFVFRWGGEEFMIIYEDMGKEKAYGCLSKLRKEISRANLSVNGENISVTVTFGAADFNEESDPEKLISIVDARLYRGKAEGRDRIIYKDKEE